MEKTYSHRFYVNAPLEKVAEFHKDSKALKYLTPFPIFVQMHKHEALAEGSLADFTMWMGPVPIRWVAQHKDIDPLHGFKDVQVRGPFSRWEHTHTFNAVDAGSSEIIDEIHAVMGKAPVSRLVSFFMWYGLPVLFAYRSWATRRLVEKNEGKVGQEAK